MPNIIGRPFSAAVVLRDSNNDYISSLSSISKAKQALLMKRNYADYKWDTFGGLLEVGETPREALKREFLEETTLSFLKSEKWGIQHPLPEETFQQTGHIFLVVPELSPTQILKAIPNREEVQKVDWIDIDLVLEEDQFVPSLVHRFALLFGKI